MRLFLAILLIFSIQPLVSAQEVIANLEGQGLSVLNEELRQSSDGIRNLKSQVADILPIDLTSTSDVSGALPIANGGTGQTTAQTAINALTAVSSATNEYVLTKDTATGNATFKALAVTQYFNLISTTNVSSATSSSAITIDKDKNYYVYISVIGTSNAQEFYGKLTFNTTSVQYFDSSAQTDGIYLTYGLNEARTWTSNFYINRRLLSDGSNKPYIVSVNGDSVGTTSSATKMIRYEISGLAYSYNSTGPTTFTVNFEETANAVIKLYEIVQ